MAVVVVTTLGARAEQPAAPRSHSTTQPTAQPTTRPSTASGWTIVPGPVDFKKELNPLLDLAAQALREYRELVIQAGVSESFHPIVTRELDRRHQRLEQLRTEHAAYALGDGEALLRVTEIIDVWPSIEAVIGRQEFVKIARAMQAQRSSPDPRIAFQRCYEWAITSFDRTRPTVHQARQFRELFRQATDEYVDLTEAATDPAVKDRKKYVLAGAVLIHLRLRDRVKVVLPEDKFREFDFHVRDEIRRWSTDEKKPSDGLQLTTVRD